MTTLIKISQLPSATTPLSGTEVMTVVQGGVTKKISSQAITDLLTSPVNAAKDAAETAAANAEAAASSASTSASLAATQVSTASSEASNSSASASSSASSALLAKDWATKTSAEVVAGQGYGAKKYAEEAAASAASIGDAVDQSAASAAAAAVSEANTLSLKNSAASSAATASSKATEASTSAINAASSASTATTKASDASASATAASASATSAAASATTATTKASDASTSATNAAASAASASASETNALSSKNSASASATTATTQAGIATAKAGEASTSATNAASSASAAATSESNALSYKDTAVSSAATATTQAGVATTQASTATAQAGIATAKAVEAASSASSASTAQAAAESARDATLAAFDSFDDRYLGAKASDPATDNDGNALQLGALYYRTQAGSEGMRVYTDIGWVAAYISGGGVLSAANNLSELTSQSTARTNLGLATVAATGDYADLTGKPTLFSGAYADLTGKPSLFSGAYADLTGKPTIPTVPTTVSSFTNDAGYLTSFTETDPVFAASPAHGISSTQITHWDSAYGWGNHASAGYLASATAATTYQTKDADLTAIAGLAGTSGLLKKTAADTWTLDTSTYLTGITSAQVTTALGFTPYNSTNPNGYITSSGSISGSAGSVAWSGVTGKPTTLAGYGITDAQPSSTAITTGNIGSQSVNYATSAGNATTAANALRAISAGSYGSVEVYGSNGSWSGIRFNTPNSVFMVRDTDSYSGMYKSNSAWIWAFNESGSLVTGTVPGSSVSGSVASATSAGNADTLDGLHLQTTGRADQPNEVVRTDAYGYIQAGWINTTSGDNGTTAINRIFASSDGYIRYYSPTNFASAMSGYLLPIAGGNLTGGLKEAKVTMGANDINLSSGNFFSKTISGATSLTVSNVPASGTTASFILDLTNGGSGTITWWSGMKWAGGTAPTLTASGRDVLGFFTHDGGTTWSGLVLAKDVK